MTDEEYRAVAREQYEKDREIEIDDSAEVSRGDRNTGEEGAYVVAWVWVRNKEEVK